MTDQNSAAGIPLGRLSLYDCDPDRKSPSASTNVAGYFAPTLTIVTAIPGLAEYAFVKKPVRGSMKLNVSEVNVALPGKTFSQRRSGYQVPFASMVCDS